MNLHGARMGRHHSGVRQGDPWLGCAANRQCDAMDALSRLDLVFCVDLTSSMAPFIQAAREQMTSILDGLRASLGDGLRVAVVGYRDHCDKNTCEAYSFIGDPREVKATLDGLVTSGGGDYPEAVFTGLLRCLALPWGKGAYRVVVLVGDAPPHACGAHGDTHPTRDPSGRDLDEMANLFEEAGIFVHALATRAEAVLERSFRRLSITSGGTFHVATGRGDAGAMGIVETIGRRFLSELAFDRRLYAAIAELSEPSAMNAESLGRVMRASIDDVNAGLMRLRQRRIVV